MATQSANQSLFQTKADLEPNQTTISPTPTFIPCTRRNHGAQISRPNERRHVREIDSTGQVLRYEATAEARKYMDLTALA